MPWWWPFRQKQRLLAESAENAEKKSRLIPVAFLRGLRGHCGKPSSSETPTKALGDRGEALARRFLKKAGLQILATNYRCPAGEIDIIALDPSTRQTPAGAETIVFVEVKTRSAGKARANGKSTSVSGVGESVGGKDAEAGDVRASSMQADAASGDRSQHDAEKAFVIRSSPATAVDARKRGQIKKTAAYYLRHYPAAGMPTRYDIVAIVLPKDGEPDIRHIKHAF